MWFISSVFVLLIIFSLRFVLFLGIFIIYFWLGMIGVVWGFGGGVNVGDGVVYKI